MRYSEPVGTIPPGPWVLYTSVINQSCCATSVAICQHQLLPAAIRAPGEAPDALGALPHPVLPADSSSLPSSSQMRGLRRLPQVPRAPPLSSPQSLLHPQGLLMKVWSPGTRLEAPLLPQRSSHPSHPPPDSYHILPQPCIYFIRPRIAF